MGGYAGNGKNLNYITIVVDRKSDSIATAFPYMEDKESI